MSSMLAGFLSRASISQNMAPEVLSNTLEKRSMTVTEAQEYLPI
jgi:hypothetical protein